MKIIFPKFVYLFVLVILFSEEDKASEHYNALMKNLTSCTYP